MSKRHQFKASGKATRSGQHRKARHKENQRLTENKPNRQPLTWSKLSVSTRWKVAPERYRNSGPLTQTIGELIGLVEINEAN